MKQLLPQTSFSLSRVFSALAETTYLLIIFLIPLWFAFVFPTFNMFELPKLLLFRFLLVAFAAFTFLYFFWAGFFKKKYKDVTVGIIQKTIKLFWPAIFLILVLVALLPFSTNTLQSFWGSYTRVQGLLSYLLYFSWGLLLFFYLAFQFVSGGKEVYNKKIKRIILTLITSSSLVAIYGILQILNIDIFFWPEAPYITGRTLSSFGQPNFLASFLLFTIPLAAYLFYKNKQTYIKFIYFLVLSSLILCLYFTASRAGIFALMAVLGIFIIRIIFFSNIKLKKKIVLGVSLLTFSLISFITLNVLVPGRINSVFNLKAGSSAARVYFFQSAANSVLDSPVIGYGLESGSEVFIKYYERDWGLHGQVGSNPDRAHNLVLDILIIGGFISLLAFSLWYYFYFKTAFSISKESKYYKISQALAYGALAYLFSLFFGFTIVVGEIYFFSFFAILASFSFVENNKDLSKRLEGKNIIYLDKENYISGALVLLVLIACVFPIGNSYKMLKSDYYLSQMDIALNNKQYAAAVGLRQLIEEIGANPIIVERANYHLATNFTEYCSYAAFADKSEELLIKGELEDIALKLNDNAYLNIFVKAKIYTCLNKSDRVSEYYTKMAELSPGWPVTYLEWGRYYSKNDNISEAIKYFNLVEINLPDINSPLINDDHKKDVYSYKYIMYKALAEAYNRQENYVLAERFFNLAFINMPADFSLLKKIADCHYLMGDKNKSLSYNLHGLDLNPNDYSWPLVVSILYNDLGEKDKAAHYSSIALNLAPYYEKNNIKEIIKNF